MIGTYKKLLQCAIETRLMAPSSSKGPYRQKHSNNYEFHEDLISFRPPSNK